MRRLVAIAAARGAFSGRRHAGAAALLESLAGGNKFDGLQEDVSAGQVEAPTRPLVPIAPAFVDEHVLKAAEHERLASGEEVCKKVKLREIPLTART